VIIARDGFVYVLLPAAVAAVFAVLGFWPVAVVFGLLAAALFMRAARTYPADLRGAGGA